MSDLSLSAKDKQRIERLIDKVPFAQYLGIEVVDIKFGEAVLRLAVRDELLRNGGLVHGGVTASLIDTAAAFVVMSVVGPDQVNSTVDLTLHYLRPVLSGVMTARAKIVRSGRRVIIAAVDVFDEAETLVATALTTYVRVEPQPKR